jgi:prepilin-type N-terminal cleavage/methylation domain-containing protein
VNQRGFTLLEVLVAALVMGIAITGLLSALSTSLRSAARLTDYDRAALLAHQKMDELLIATKVQKLVVIEGTWVPELTGGLQIGWRARITPFEAPPGSGVGTPILERVELEIWWMNGDQRRTFTLEGFRRAAMTPEEVAAGAGK